MMNRGVQSQFMAYLHDVFDVRSPSGVFEGVLIHSVLPVGVPVLLLHTCPSGSPAHCVTDHGDAQIGQVVDNDAVCRRNASMLHEFVQVLSRDA